MLRAILSLTQRQKRWIFAAIDVVLVPTCFAVALVLLHGKSLSASVFVDHTELIVALMICAIAISYSVGLYRIKLKSFERHAVRRMLLASMALGLCSMAFNIPQSLPLRHHALFGMAHFLCLIASRAILLEILLAIYRATGETRRFLIYGAGQTGMQLASALRSQQGVLPVGFVDDNPALAGQIIHGLHVYRGLDLAKALSETQPDRVIIAMPSTDRPTVARLERTIKALGAETQSIPSFAQLLGDVATRTTADLFLGRDATPQMKPDDSLVYIGKTVLVTGAGGTVGSELCRQLLALNPAKILLLDHSELALYTINAELREAGFDDLTVYLGSVCDRDLLAEIFTDHHIDMILHAAAYKHVPMVENNPMSGLKNNVLGTQVLAQAAIAAGVSRFVLISSDKAVEPASVMGLSKHLSEQIIRDLASRSWSTRFATVRFGNVLGSSGSVIPLFQDQVARGGPVTLTDPRASRYFMTVQEATQLVLTAAGLDRIDGTFVLDMGTPISIQALARNVIETAGYSVRDENNPDGQIEMVTTGLRAGEKLHETLTCGEKEPVEGHDKIWRVYEPQRSQFEIALMIRSLESGDIDTVLNGWHVAGTVLPTAPNAPVRTY